MEMLLWAIFQSPSSWRNTSTSRAVSRANSASGMGSRMWKNAVTATTSMPMRPGTWAKSCKVTSTQSLRLLTSWSLLPAKPLKLSLKRVTSLPSRAAYISMYSSNSRRISRWRSGDMEGVPIEQREGAALLCRLRPGALMNVALHALSVHVHVHVHVHVLCAASKTPLAELLHLVSRTAPSPRLQARVKTPNSEFVAGNANKEAVRVRALGDARCRRYFQRRCARLGKVINAVVQVARNVKDVFLAPRQPERQ